MFLVTQLSYAQETTNTKSNPVNFGFQITFESEIFDQTRTINIALPQSFDEASKEHIYPVFILLEDEFFQMVSGVVKHLSSVERIPEMIVVSIKNEPSAPTIHTNGSNFWPGPQLVGENHDQFTDHIRNELIPYLKDEFRANDFHVVMGLSYTSIYVLHSFVKEPNLFDAHIAIAAGDILGMGYSEGERFIDLIESEIKGRSDKKRYLYITSADADGGGKAPEIKENLEELDRKLYHLENQNLKFFSGIYPNEGHYDVALPGLMNALAIIFPKKQWFARYRDIVAQPGDALQNLDNYYDKLSKAYGFQILPRAERWNSVNRLSWIGPRLVKQGRITEGIAIIERWVQYQPYSHIALAELSSAYQVAGDLDKSKLALKHAIQLVKGTQPEVVQEYLVRLKRLEK